jgi:hypothetical protein
VHSGLLAGSDGLREPERLHQGQHGCWTHLQVVHEDEDLISRRLLAGSDGLREPDLLHQGQQGRTGCVQVCVIGGLHAEWAAIRLGWTTGAGAPASGAAWSIEASTRCAQEGGLHFQLATAAGPAGLGWCGARQSRSQRLEGVCSDKAVTWQARSAMY